MGLFSWEEIRSELRVHSSLWKRHGVSPGSPEVRTGLIDGRQVGSEFHVKRKKHNTGVGSACLPASPLWHLHRASHWRVRGSQASITEVGRAHLRVLVFHPVSHTGASGCRPQGWGGPESPRMITNEICGPAWALPSGASCKTREDHGRRVLCQ